MPKNSANKQYLRIQNSSLLNDVKESIGDVLYRQNPSIPQQPQDYKPISFCFSYFSGSTAFTQTLTGTSVASGITYYNLTHGVVWSDGTNWNWTASLGVVPTGSTRYSTLNNGGKPIPNSLGYSWVTFSGASSGTSMTNSLKGVCPPASTPLPTPASSVSPTPSPTVTPTITPSPSA